MDTKTVIGKAEKVDLPEQAVKATYARIDTGAKTSAIWAGSVQLTSKGLAVVFFAAGSPWFTGETVHFDSFEETVVVSSNGAAERRFKVRLVILLGGRRIRAWFTLADRSTQVYPLLVGRNVLHGKFLVDVSFGSDALLAVERERSELLRKQLTEES